MRTLLTGILLVVPAALVAQKPAAPIPARSSAPVATSAGGPILEVIGGGGYTFVNNDAWAGSSALDWSNGNYRVGVRAFLPTRGRLQLGAEVAYQDLYWYQLDATWSYAERSFEPTIVGAVGRLSLQGNMALDFGVAMYKFSGFTDFGPNVALGYFIPIGSRTSIPVQARLDYISDKDGAAVPLQLTAGISYRLK